MGKDVFSFHVEKVSEGKNVVFFSSYLALEKNKGLFDWWRYKDSFLNVAYINDETNSWYHYCYDELEDFIGSFVNSRSLMVGVSAGAYIALIMADKFGCYSMALNPQTTLSQGDLDRSWRRKYQELVDMSPNKEILDIMHISGPQHHIYYSVESESDKFHAERMNVTLHPYPCSIHGIGKWMSENGILEQELNKRVADIE